MRLIRPPQRLHRQMTSARPASELSPELTSEIETSGVAADVSEHSFMDRILTCDRLAWEAAERCAGLRREQGALLRDQATHREPDPTPDPHADLLAGVLREQLERTRERLDCAERSYRGATQLLRETITEALAHRIVPSVLARRLDPHEPEASGGGLR